MIDFDWIALIEALGGGLAAGVIVGLIALLVTALLVIRWCARKILELMETRLSEKDARLEREVEQTKEIFQITETMRTAIQAINSRGGGQ